MYMSENARECCVVVAELTLQVNEPDREGKSAERNAKCLDGIDKTDMIDTVPRLPLKEELMEFKQACTVETEEIPDVGISVFVKVEWAGAMCASLVRVFGVMRVHGAY